MEAQTAVAVAGPVGIVEMEATVPQLLQLETQDPEEVAAVAVVAVVIWTAVAVAA
jgi:hypothetical protein